MNGTPFGSSSRWDVIHDETGIRCRYYGKADIPEGFVWPWVHDVFYSLTKEERILNMVNGKKLPMLKEFAVPCTSPTLSWSDFKQASDSLQKANCPVTNVCIADYPCAPYSLGDCKPIPPMPCVEMPYGMLPGEVYPYQNQQGTNPMGYEIKTTAAVASIINSATDESKQRDFLLEELRRFSPYDWRTPFDAELHKMFNIDAPRAPRSSQELLDAFKAGAISIDQKKVDMNTAYNAGDGSCEDDDGEYVGAQYYGITFTTLPIEDRKGYTKAKEEFDAAKVDTKRTIMIGTPAEGLAALKALESWKTTVIPATTPVTAAA